MNTNLAHNLLNIAMIVVAGLAGFDYVGMGLDPIMAGKIVAVLGGIKMVINVLRDGVTGLTKPQPPVQK